MNIIPLNGQLYVAPRIIKSVGQEEQNVVELNNHEVLNSEEQILEPNYGKATTAQYLANVGIKIVDTSKTATVPKEPLIVNPSIEEKELAENQEDNKELLPPPTVLANESIFRKIWNKITDSFNNLINRFKDEWNKFKNDPIDYIFKELPKKIFKSVCNYFLDLFFGWTGLI